MIGTDPSPAHLGVVVVQQVVDELSEGEARLLVVSQQVLSIPGSDFVSQRGVEVEALAELDSEGKVEVGVEVKLDEAEDESGLDPEASVVDEVAELEVLVLEVEEQEVQREYLLEELGESELLVCVQIEGLVEVQQEEVDSIEVVLVDIGVLAPIESALSHGVSLSEEQLQVLVAGLQLTQTQLDLLISAADVACLVHLNGSLE